MTREFGCLRVSTVLVHQGGDTSQARGPRRRSASNSAGAHIGTRCKFCCQDLKLDYLDYRRKGSPNRHFRQNLSTCLADEICHIVVSRTIISHIGHHSWSEPQEKSESERLSSDECSFSAGDTCFEVRRALLFLGFGRRAPMLISLSVGLFRPREPSSDSSNRYWELKVSPTYLLRTGLVTRSLKTGPYSSSCRMS